MLPVRVIDQDLPGLNMVRIDSREIMNILTNSTDGRT
jgi:hypothetical protein